MDDLTASIDQLAQQGNFSGVVRVEQDGGVVFERAYGLAHRGYGIPNRVDTQFGLASGTKIFTALTVLSLVAQGRLDLATPARELLRDDLPLIDPGVTVEHLLSHRSGIGDYLDEDEEQPPNAYVMPVPVHQLDTAEHYLPVLDGLPMKFTPGTAFSYCNSGYVVLALLVERCAAQSFAQAVRQWVCDPAGLTQTAFLRPDELPAGAATGYLSPPLEDRSNVFHLPVVGSGDGGLYSTVQDVHALWSALLAGRIIPAQWVQDMLTPRSTLPSGEGYGLGVWRAGARMQISGMDPGVSLISSHLPEPGATYTVVSNTAEGTWPLIRLLRERIRDSPLP